MFDPRLQAAMELRGWKFNTSGHAFKNRAVVGADGNWYVDYKSEVMHLEINAKEAFERADAVITSARPLLVSDVPINKLTVGQVVKFPAHWAAIVQITAEIGGHFIKWEQDGNNKSGASYNRQRYSSIVYLMEHGRVVQGLFHMNDDYVMVDRVLQEYNIVQHPKGTEFFRFDEIVKEESHTWKELVYEPACFQRHM